MFDQYLQKLDNQLTSYRPWFAHFSGLLKISVATAHKYRGVHDPTFAKLPLMDSALELVDDLLAIAYELDNNISKSKAFSKKAAELKQ